MTTLRFPVGATDLMLFARAIGEPKAATTDFSTAIAPPTFTISNLQFVPKYRLRPEPGVQWIGSGRADTGLDPDAGAGEFGSGLHAEQEFEYLRPVRAGMVLLVDSAAGATWAKARRDGGHLAFSEQVSEFRDESDGSLVQRSRQVAVEIKAEPAPANAAPPPRPAADDTSSAGSLTVGETRELVAFDPVTRSQLVMYAGASGDYNPLHTDEPFATRVAGYPSVFAHGMLTMAASGRILTDWFDVEQLRSYRVQFRGQVWPSDTLRVSAVAETTSTIALTTTDADGRVVMTGRAVVGPPN